MGRSFVALRGALLLLAVAPAVAQHPLSWATHGFSRSEQKVLHPLIQTMLKQSNVGDVRAWQSADGKAGNVVLLAGGERAGAADARVRITVIRQGHEHTLFTFYYRHDPRRGWGVAG